MKQRSGFRILSVVTILLGLGVVVSSHLSASVTAHEPSGRTAFGVLQESTDPTKRSDPHRDIDSRILRGWDAFQERCRNNEELKFLKKIIDRSKYQHALITNRCEPHIDLLLKQITNPDQQAAMQRELRLRTSYARSYVEQGYLENKDEPSPLLNAYKGLRNNFSQLEFQERRIQTSQERLVLVQWRASQLSWPALEDDFKAEGKPLQQGWDLATLADSGWTEGEVTLEDGSKGILVRCGLYMDSLKGREPKAIPEKLLLVLGTSRVPCNREVGPAGMTKGTVASLKGFQTVMYKGETVEIMACYLGSLTKALAAKRRNTESKELRSVSETCQFEDLTWASGTAFDSEPPEPQSR